MLRGCPARPVSLAFVDVVERIRSAGVFGKAAVVEVDAARVGIDDDIFQHRAEALRRGENLRFRLAREVDRLGVAAALEIEDAVPPPAMLIVADQRAARIGGERRLAGAGEAEENRRVSVRPHIRGAVHRHHAARRQHEIEVGEDRLLHLARIGGAGDEHDAAREVAGDHRLGAGAVALVVGAHARQIDDRQVRNEGRKLGEFGANEEIADEQRVPRIFRDDACAHTVIGVGAAVEVLREEFAVLRVGNEIVEQRVEVRALHGLVEIPSHRRVGGCVADDELVLRRAPGVRASGDGKRAAIGDLPLTAPDRLLHQFRGGKIGVECRPAGNDRGEIGGVSDGLRHADSVAPLPAEPRDRAGRRQSEKTILLKEPTELWRARILQLDQHYGWRSAARSSAMRPNPATRCPPAISKRQKSKSAKSA